jgi:hypothetical protein
MALGSSKGPAREPGERRRRRAHAKQSRRGREEQDAPQSRGGGRRWRGRRGRRVTFAAHVPEIDPATVSTGLFVAHNYVADVPVSRICAGGRAERRRRLRPPFEPGSQPGVRMAGPVVVTVRSGSLTYQDAGPNACRNRTYTVGQGFVDPGFGHVHPVIAGRRGPRFTRPSSCHPGAENHVITAPARRSVEDARCPRRWELRERLPIARRRAVFCGLP